MKFFIEDPDSNIFTVRGGVIAKISGDGGYTTDLAAWSYGDPIDIQYYEGNLYILTSGRVSMIDVQDLSLTVWSRTFSFPILGIRVIGGELAVYGLSQNHLEKTLLDVNMGITISTTFPASDVGNVSALDVTNGAMVLAGIDGEKGIFVKYYGVEGWDATYDLFGAVQPGSLTLKIQQNGNIFLGYNENTAGGGWDPRAIMLNQTGEVVWSKETVFATPDADRIIGVRSNGTDIFLVYASEGGPKNLTRVVGATGDVVYSVPIPSLQGVFSGGANVFGADVDLDNNKLNMVFSTSNFVGGLTNASPGPYLGMVRFSITEPITGDAHPTNIEVTGVQGFVFTPEVFDYALEIENTQSNVSFAVTNANSEQTTVIKVNGRVVSATQFSIPIGPTVFGVETTVGGLKTLYSITITRLPPSGLVYVDAGNGAEAGRGTIMTPMKSITQAIKLVGRTLVLRIKDYLPLFNQDGTFEIIPSRGGEDIQVDVVKLKNGSENKIYALGVLPSLRNSINGKTSILSFFIKVYDEETDQFLQNVDPLELEFNLPPYFTRSELLLYREETTGTVTQVPNGPVKVGGSVFTLTLNSNSLYTLTDSDLFIPTAGIGSDPHITTLFGETYTLHKLSRYGRVLDILTTPFGGIRGRVTGLVNGEYLDSVDVRVGEKSVMRVKFGSRGRGKIEYGAGVKEVTNVRVEIDNFRRTTRQNRVFLVEGLWKDGVLIYVNDEHRYVCPIFRSQPSEDQRELFGGVCARKVHG
jgi:hypothetical protein